MATSKIEICNIALSLIGADEIRAFDEDNTRASMCDQFFDSSRNYILSLHDWTFARAFELLRELDLEEGALPEGRIGYQKPTECLIPTDIHPRGEDIAWELIGDMVVTVKQTPVYLYYTKNVDNPAKFSPVFIECLALHLAYRLANPIKQDPDLAGAMQGAFGQAMVNATTMDANIGSEYRAHDEDPNNDSFVTGRNLNYFPPGDFNV